MKLYQEKRNRVTGLLFGLLALISIDVWLFSTMGYGMARWFAMLFLLLGLVLRIEHAFYLYIFCFPFSSILKFSDTSISILPLLNLIMILRLLWKKQVRIDGLQLLAFFGLLVMQLLCVLFYDASVMSVGSFFISLFFVLCSASYFSRQQNRQDIFLRATAFYVAALIAGVILCDLLPDTMYLIDRKKQAMLVYGARFGSIFVEPNEFAQAVLVGMGLLVTIIPTLGKKSHKIMALISLIYLGISGYRSLSKSYVLTLLGLFVVFLIMNWYRTGKQKGLGMAAVKMLPGMLMLGIGAWVILQHIVIPTFESRITGDFWTGRGRIWTQYLAALIQRVDIMLLGSGVGNTTVLANTNAMIGTAVTHNVYLEYLIQFGVFGMVLLMIIFVRLIRRNSGKLCTYFVLVLAAYLATAIGISANANDCIFITMLFTSIPFAEKYNCAGT